MNKKRLQIEQLDSKIKIYSPIVQIANPPTGWIKAVRLALGMTMQQLANHLSITKQSVLEMEQREIDGSISLKTLREAARVLDMDLVYGFVPKDGSLEKLIDRKTNELATKIVLRTSNTMKLENQENSEERLKKAIEERRESLKYEMPKVIWD